MDRAEGGGRMNIVLHIERVILDGVSLAPHERPLLQAALEAELGRLLAEGGLGNAFQTGGAVPRLAGGTVEHGADRTPANLGESVARAVYAGLGDQGAATEGRSNL